jgi:hypothetical protein
MILTMADEKVWPAALQRAKPSSQTTPAQELGLIQHPFVLART